MARNMHLCDRLRTVRESMRWTQSEMAERMGVSLRAYQTYEAAERQPRATDVAPLGEFGVNLNWLLIGLGSMRAETSLAPGFSETSEMLPLPVNTAAATDHRLIGRLTEGIARVYKEEGHMAALHLIAEQAARYHDRILLEVDDPDDRLLYAGEILAELRHELRRAALRPNETKRSA